MDKKTTLDMLNVKVDLPNTLEGCHELIRVLLKEVQKISELTVRIEKLETENSALKERLNNNSSNSSLLPSKDWQKKKSKKIPSKNPTGDQKGYKGYFRQLLESHEVDTTVNCALPSYCACGGSIKRKVNDHRHQVYELPEMKLHVTEYRLEKERCGRCGRCHMSKLPAGVTDGITGPKLTSLMSHLVSRYRLSRRELTAFLEEHFGFTISLGTIFNKQKDRQCSISRTGRSIISNDSGKSQRTCR